MFRTSEAKKNEKIRRSLVVMEQPEQVPSVAEQLALLRQEVGQMRRSMEDAGIVRKSRDAEKDNELRVSFARDGEGRKPFSCSIKLGARSLNVRLSSIRYAILFSLFLDLHKRRHTGAGLEDIRATIRHCYEILEGEHCPLESLRVGLYQALRQFDSCLTSYGLVVDGERIRVDFDSAALSSEVHLSVEEPLLAPVCNRLGGLSMLDRIRNAKALVLPRGPESIDRTLLELYEGKHILEISSLYFRLDNLTFPREMLERMNASAIVLARRRLYEKRLGEGTLKAADVIPRASIWEQIRADENGRLIRYPEGATAQDVFAHFDYILEMMKTSGYSLTLVTSEAPFYFVKYELRSVEKREAFILFPRREQGILHDLSGMVVYNENLGRDMEDLVLASIRNHPGTLQTISDIRAVFEEVKSHLRDHGPLRPGQTVHR